MIKHVVIGAGAIGAAYGIFYLMRLKRLSAELEAVTAVRIHKIDFEGIELAINVTLKNPTAGSLRVKHPFVKLLSRGKTIVSSEIKDTNITITKFSEVDFEPIKVRVGFIKLGTTVPDLLREYRETGKLQLDAEIITTINDSVAFKKTEPVTLGGGKQA